jgi:hypothetical protein
MPDGVARSNDAPRINAGADKMNTISKWALALALLSGPAYGQVPSTNDTSDGYDNTGMGKGALFNVTPGNSGIRKTVCYLGHVSPDEAEIRTQGSQI